MGFMPFVEFILLNHRSDSSFVVAIKSRSCSEQVIQSPLALGFFSFIRSIFFLLQPKLEAGKVQSVG